MSGVFNFCFQGISQLLGWRDSDTVYPGAGISGTSCCFLRETPAEEVGSILLIPVCVEFRVGKRGSVFVSMSQFIKALDELLLLFFNIYLFGLQQVSVVVYRIF